MDRKQYVRGMFGAIAHRYDLMNRLMTGGLDQRWRRKVARLAAPGPGRVTLDLATGTGDIALALLEGGGAKTRVIGLDFSEQMLRSGADKFARYRAKGRHRVLVGDIESMSIQTGTVDAVTIGFGVRNLGDMRKGLEEMHRVLRSGGRLVILEASRPPWRLIARITRLWTNHVLPVLGRLVSGDRHAYSYLPWSVEHFPERTEVLAILRDIGFEQTRCEDCFLGVASIFFGIKSKT